MLHSTATSSDAHGAIPVSKTAFAVFGIREVNTETFDTAVTAAGNALVCVFPWGVDCFNYEMAKKAMFAQSGAVRELGLKWLHANVYAYPELGQRFAPHGIPVFIFFHRSEKLGRATGWHGHAQFAAAVASVRNKLASGPLVWGCDHHGVDVHGCGLLSHFVFPCCAPQMHDTHLIVRHSGDDRGPCRRSTVVLVPLRHVAAGLALFHQQF